jgi:hypothetical protein
MILTGEFGHGPAEAVRVTAPPLDSKAQYISSGPSVLYRAPGASTAARPAADPVTRLTVLLPPATSAPDQRDRSNSSAGSLQLASYVNQSTDQPYLHSQPADQGFSRGVPLKAWTL